MAYLKLNNVDFSHCVNQLAVNETANYNAETNAAGDTVIDFINSKRAITVGIIPLNSADMVALLDAIKAFGVSVSYRNPKTEQLEENVQCILSSYKVDYYTIQESKVSYKAFTLEFVEL